MLSASNSSPDCCCSSSSASSANGVRRFGAADQLPLAAANLGGGGGQRRQKKATRRTTTAEEQQKSDGDDGEEEEQEDRGRGGGQPRQASGGSQLASPPPADHRSSPSLLFQVEAPSSPEALSPAGTLQMSLSSFGLASSLHQQADQDHHHHHHHHHLHNLLPMPRSCLASPQLSRQSSGGSYSGRPLSSHRYNKSCDWLLAAGQQPGDPSAGGTSALPSGGAAMALQPAVATGDDNFRSNPIAQVSSEVLRAHGYTQQFKTLLSSGPRSRRDSGGSTGKGGALSQQQSLEERAGPAAGPGALATALGCNGDLHSHHHSPQQQQHQQFSCLSSASGIPQAAFCPVNAAAAPGPAGVNQSAGPIGALGGGGCPAVAIGTPVSGAKSLEWNLATLEDGGGGKVQQQQQQTAAAHRQIRRRQSGYGISITTESQAKMRCKLRKLYFVKRNKICDLSLALALIGLAFVVLEQELTALQVVSKRSAPSLLLRSACVASTLMLIGSLINYHRTEVRIALIDSGAEDWRVALTTDRVIKLMIEIAVCAVCPFPGSGTINWPYISADERRVTMESVPLDVLLSVPMFLRAYLLCRFMVLHSRQFQDAATRSIAALNRISMDFRFVIKTMMADHPMTVLIVFTVSYWICMSWMFTQCERYNGRYEGTEHYYMNSLWFIMVTFMSIGYGDVVPTSYCGRFLSISTGIVGAGVSSALIAVISRKLELSRAEKHVNNFMADSKLTNARKNAAAAVLQHTWFIHKYQQRNGQKGEELRLRQHQRKFLNAINDFRRIKWDQRKLQEKGNSLLDVGKLHTEMHETLWEMHRTQDQFAGMIGKFKSSEFGKCHFTTIPLFIVSFL